MRPFTLPLLPSPVADSIPRRYIFEGLSRLMDELLVHNARYIRLANRFGQAKMLRNILALQQNLKNLGDSPLDVNFERSRRFWDLFVAGPKVSAPSLGPVVAPR